MARIYIFLMLFLFQTVALAQDASPLLEQAFLKDPFSQMSVEQVSQAEFLPYEGNLGLGFQPGAVWTRLKIGPASQAEPDKPRSLVVRVGPNYLQRIELFAPRHGEWSRQLRGSLMPEASRHCPDDMHCFALELPASEVSTVYLRIKHPGFMVALIEVLPPEALPFAVAKRTKGMTVSIVIALAMLALGLTLLVVDRSVLLLAYCCFQLAIVLFIASNAGLIGQFLPFIPTPLLSTFNGLSYVLRVAMTAVLAWAMLRPYRTSPFYLLGAQLLLGLCVLLTVLVLWGHMQAALMGCLLVFSLLPFWQLFGALSAQDLPSTQRRLLVGGIGLYILLLVLGLWINFIEPSVISRTNPVKQIADWRLNGFAIGILFFWMTMLERASQKRVSAQEVEVLRQAAVEAQTRQAELDERSSLVDMLTHELKNPLGTIRFALASLRQQVLPSGDTLRRIQSIDASTRRMDDLVERVASFCKIERTTPTDHPPVLNGALLIQELIADMADQEQWDVQVQPGATFCCDRQLLWVILENLMTNASKYSVPRQPIRVSVVLESSIDTQSRALAEGRAVEYQARLEISNAVDPSSIPDAASLFDRYYRHPNVQNKAGMGLGLSVVKSAVPKIGGHVAYRYEQGRAFFTLWVPA